MKIFEFKYKAVFEGTVEVRAENRQEAKEIVQRDFGLSTPYIANSNESNEKDEEGIVDWEFDSHPTKTVIK
jgi:hypothetical protein